MKVPASLGLSAEQMTEVLTAAGQAPSLHNTQPWLFHVQPDAVVLYADRSRQLQATDPDAREVRLSCGAALFNLRLGLRMHGVRPLVTIHPWEYPGAEAVVFHGGVAEFDAETEPLWRAVPHRRTNRRPFWDEPVSLSLQHVLRQAADSERCLLTVLDPPQETQLRRLLAQANRHQLADVGCIAEFRHWTGLPSDATEGVPQHAGGPAPGDHNTWSLRDFGHGAGRTRTPRKDFERAPLIAVLSTPADTPYHQVQAGEALQHLLLAATAHGLAASFMSQIIEVEDARRDLRRILGGYANPQAVIRIGYGSPVVGSLRRPMDDLILDRAPSPQIAGGSPLDASTLL